MVLRDHIDKNMNVKDTLMKRNIMHIGLVGLISLLLATESYPVDAGGISRSVSKAIGKKIGNSSVRRVTARQSSMKSMKAAEAAALRRELAKLDQQSLQKIERLYGKYIPANQLKQARASSAKFLNRNAYQKQLHRNYPDLSPQRRANVVGHYEKRVYVDRNQALLPRNVAHERIHQLGHKGYRIRVGEKLNEGTTEFLASRVYKDLGIRNMPVSYPRQRRVIEMISARVGEKRVARAYFQGDVLPLKRQLDKQLGRGAFDNIAIAVDRGNYKAAEKILTAVAR